MPQEKQQLYPRLGPTVYDGYDRPVDLDHWPLIDESRGQRPAALVVGNNPNGFGLCRFLIAITTESAASDLASVQPFSELSEGEQHLINRLDTR